jgi:hypothetical protein
MTIRHPHAVQMRAYLAWAFICVVWGTTYLAIRICLETVPPLLMGGLRYSISGGLMIAAMVIGRQPLPPLRAWPPLALLGALMLGFGNGGVVWAELTVASGLTAVLVAMSPFWMVGFDAVAPPRVPLTMRRTIGLVVGFSGIVLLVWPGDSRHGRPWVSRRRPRFADSRAPAGRSARCTHGAAATATQGRKHPRDGGVSDAVRRFLSARRPARRSAKHRGSRSTRGRRSRWVI